MEELHMRVSAMEGFGREIGSTFVDPREKNRFGRFKKGSFIKIFGFSKKLVSFYKIFA